MAETDPAEELPTPPAPNYGDRFERTVTRPKALLSLLRSFPVFVFSTLFLVVFGLLALVDGPLEGSSHAIFLLVLAFASPFFWRVSRREWQALRHNRPDREPALPLLIYSLRFSYLTIGSLFVLCALVHHTRITRAGSWSFFKAWGCAVLLATLLSIFARQRKQP